MQGLSEGVDRIARDVRIRHYQDQTVFDALTDQQAIEGIAVTVGEFDQLCSHLLMDRQQPDAKAFAQLHKVPLGRTRHLQRHPCR